MHSGGICFFLDGRHLSQHSLYNIFCFYSPVFFCGVKSEVFPMKSLSLFVRKIFWSSSIFSSESGLGYKLAASSSNSIQSMIEHNILWNQRQHQQLPDGKYIQIFPIYDWTFCKMNVSISNYLPQIYVAMSPFINCTLCHHLLPRNVPSFPKVNVVVSGLRFLWLIYTGPSLTSCLKW